MQLITEVYEDSKGIDFQRLYKVLEKSQQRTGRDSVQAKQTIGNRAYYNQVCDSMTKRALSLWDLNILNALFIPVFDRRMTQAS